MTGIFLSITTKGTEIMPNDKEKPQLSLIKPEERTPDGNLLPDVRERVITSIQTYLRKCGYLNISEIAQKLGLSRQTTKKLTDEILAIWRMEIENQIIVQLKRHREIVRDIDEDPDSFSKEKITLIKLKSTHLNKINTLLKTLIK